jgi:hypothetical protein
MFPAQTSKQTPFFGSNKTPNLNNDSEDDYPQDHDLDSISLELSQDVNALKSVHCNLRVTELNCALPLTSGFSSLRQFALLLALLLLSRPT